MSCRDREEKDDAPLPPGFSTLAKASRNDGVCHAEPDAEGIEDESDADVEKQFDESTGKKREYDLSEPVDVDARSCDSKTSSLLLHRWVLSR
jgi:hypothetical protein